MELHTSPSPTRISKNTLPVNLMAKANESEARDRLERAVHKTKATSIAQAGSSAELDFSKQLENAALSERNQVLEEQVKDLESYRKLREEYSGKMFLLTGLWLAGIWFLVFSSGFSLGWFKGFMLSDQILLALIGSSVVPSLLTIVLKNLFPDQAGAAPKKK